MPAVLGCVRFPRSGVFFAALALIALAAMASRPALADHSSHTRDATQGKTQAMDPEVMRKGIADWFGKRPAVGVEESRRLLAQGAFADTFIATFDQFDNGDSQSDLDTARVFENEFVLWQWAEGTHTVTNGENSSDPNAGTLFNVPHDSSWQQFVFQFQTAGIYPFFCVIHEDLPMKGVVKVSTRASVIPIGPSAARIGFTRPPSPNPSRTGFTFRFGMRERGSVRAQVFDAAGRAVSTIVDRDFEPGTYAAAWDGKGRNGSVRPGVYWLRLSVPGAQESRRLVVSN